MSDRKKYSHKIDLDEFKDAKKYYAKIKSELHYYIEDNPDNTESDYVDNYVASVRNNWPMPFVKNKGPKINEFRHLMQLLNNWKNRIPKSSTRKSPDTFHWTGHKPDAQLKYLMERLIKERFLSDETSLKSFKAAFGIGKVKKPIRIEWEGSIRQLIYLFEYLIFPQKFLKDNIPYPSMLENHAIFVHEGILLIASSLRSSKSEFMGTATKPGNKSGKPKRAEDIEKILADLEDT